MSTTYIAGYDGSESSKAALHVLSRLAESTSAEIIAAAVYKQTPLILGKTSSASPVEELNAASRRSAEEMLAETGVPSITHTAVGGRSPAEGLQTLADDQEAAVIAVGVTHRGAVGRLTSGSVADHLLHGSHCPVLVVPADWADKPIETIAVAYDGRDESKAALSCATSLATTVGAKLVLLSVYEEISAAYLGSGYPFAASELNDELRADQRADAEQVLETLPAEVRAEARFAEGPAAHAIVREAEDGVDLLVAGSRGFGPVRSVLVGSVSRHLVDHAPCPVLVVPRSATRRELTDVPAAAAEQG